MTSNKQALLDALILSTEILRHFELSEFPLTNIALKTCRLARLLNDFDYLKILEYEAGGYPTTRKGVSHEVWRLAEIAGRRFDYVDDKTKEISQRMYRESISQLEESLRIAETSLSAARDPDISISSPNFHQLAAAKNTYERGAIRGQINENASRLAQRRGFIYQYVAQKYYELKYSGIADDIFTRYRQTVDARIGYLVPDAVQKFTAVYENLQSENPENWSNAVHSCRRILQDLADALFPPTEDKVIPSGGKSKTIKLGKEQYINRLMAFVEESSNSGRFTEIVGSTLDYLGKRLDSIYEATNKGSHTTIVKPEEAERYVIYTYLLVGDILSLKED